MPHDIIFALQGHVRKGGGEGPDKTTKIDWGWGGGCNFLKLQGPVVHVKGTVSRDFLLFFGLVKKLYIPEPNMNMQQRFREIFRFREDIRE